MAKKSKLFKDMKTVKKTAGKTALNSVVTGATFLAMKGIQNKVAEKVTNPNMQKAIGPIAAVGGIILEAFSDQSQLAAVGRGMAIAGMDRSAETFIPATVKEKMGLSGTVGQKADKEVDGNAGYWERIRQEAEQAMRDMGNDAPDMGGTPDHVDMF